ncbi:MAG: S41 family peptidase [Bacteroidota bacterium]
MLRLALLLSLVLVSAAPGQPAGWQYLSVDDQYSELAQGVWQSRGYGWVLNVAPDSAIIYTSGAAGCIADPIITGYIIEEPKMLIRTAGTSMDLAFREANSTRYTFDRLPALPDACTQIVPDTPSSVFDYAWTVMNEQYAFFDEHGVDWAARRAEIEPRIRDDMSDAELFDALEAMLAGLNDGHIELTGEVDGEDRRYSGQGAPVLRPLLQTWFERQDEHETFQAFANDWYFGSRRRIRSELLNDSSRTTFGGNVFWGRIGQTGYINVAGMSGFKNEDSETFYDQIENVHGMMDDILTDLADTDAIIIDVMLNQGGFDEIGLAIAQHFANHPTPGVTKYAGNAEADTRQTMVIQPARGVRYLKPVYVLTSDVSVSAAETFTMYMRALPTVTHAGSTTRGALSDILFRPLPNEWLLELSNEVYLDAEDELWEARGIPPELPLTVFAEKTPYGHLDAIAELARRAGQQ